MANIGWIGLHRKITEHWLYPNLRKYTEFEAWLYILLHASFADSKVADNGQLIIVKRGELLTSEQKLGFVWLWDRGKVRRFLKLLQHDGMILKKSTSKFTKITVCNYESYQDFKTTDEHQTNIKRTSDKHQTNTLEEGKEDINKVNKVNKEGVFNFTHKSEMFFTTWNILIKQPKWKKKTNHALQASLNKLDLYPENVAIQMMNDTIAGGWQGLFEPKNIKPEPQPKLAGKSAAELTAEIMKKYETD